MLNFKRFYSLLFLALGILTGCVPMENSEQNSALTQCPPNPTIALLAENIELVDPLGESVERQDSIHQTAIGYQFTGKEGDELDYAIDPGLCLWIFAPNNQLVTTTTLPMDGNYVIQIQPKLKKEDFNLSFRLQRPNYFASQSFPQTTCGDQKPQASDVDSVQFYPVNISYSPSSLQFAITNYCGDAYQKTEPDTGRKLVQISSFLSQEKAQEFADFVNERMNGTVVGEPTTIYLR
ncbi:hypothetical protein IQE94_13215 [Synechocystis sp. PCC 7339]|uniref:hypothetical protein n=1 Tax=Synechocystis sp. PCC 7339 TaxID=2782213 RepID=UPI001CBD8425|nr:hypothetical protein [Synechocystis sp. PCC 7339]UAJ72056.1 hypothetical protein IQE94_13215 [Synechocystis sp. PCC 7339]